MPRTGSIPVLLLLLLLVVALPAQAAPTNKADAEVPSFLSTLFDLVDDLRDTLTAWIGHEGSGVDPFGNQGTAPPPEGSGSDPWGNHAGSDVDPWGGS